jgi:hypothetical protein
MPYDLDTLEREARRIVKLWSIENRIPLSYVQAIQLEEHIVLSLGIAVENVQKNGAKPEPKVKPEPKPALECPICHNAFPVLGRHLWTAHRKDKDWYREYLQNNPVYTEPA